MIKKQIKTVLISFLKAHFELSRTNCLILAVGIVLCRETAVNESMDP